MEIIESVGLKEIVSLQEPLGTVYQLHMEVEDMKVKLSTMESDLVMVSSTIQYSNFLLTFLAWFELPWFYT